ncbi:hydroxymethylglutaryl-CoA reductase [Haloferula sp. BvORR071]|uniref:hydroxymethylglutaryl-CoA reductase n=1 Tax=Haloferula sp. BvORR071 TaxID=1396141 RepID=UPI00069662F7|nr:hydroxymethylglutaryl-CoA reductase [Haloferula sp. BvORR071]
MTGKRGLTQQHVARILGGESPEVVAARLGPNFDNLPAVPAGSAKVTAQRAEALWQEAGLDLELQAILLNEAAVQELPVYQGNIENAIGLLKLPLGLAGPLRINGTTARGDYPIPLATTEAALVASYHRGCRLLTEAGGCTALVLFESLSRAPAFVLRTAAEACRFTIWAMENFEVFQEIANATTSHGKMVDVGVTLEGNHVYLNFEFTTGDASGQNMVTIASQAVCDYIVEHTPVPLQRHYVESNLSGDKKASTKAYTSTRGKKVTAEALIPAELVKKHLHTTPRAMEQYWQMSAIGGVLSGTLGIHGHFANGLTALYLATGQDAACVAESATGVTRFEVTEEGDLYSTVTLPGIMVGTVGGGTRLPTQKACLELMGLAGAGKARALAEVCAGLLLAGELSIIGALSAGHFARAHRKLARGKKNE